MEALLYGVEFGVYIATVVVGFAFVWQQWSARRRARAAKAIEAPVLYVGRFDSGSRMHSWVVETTYDVPGYGERVHRKGFDKEGQALLFQRLHREGSVHRVVPNEALEGHVFLEEELAGRMDWAIAALMALAVVLAAWAAWAVAVEYWEP